MLSYRFSIYKITPTVFFVASKQVKISKKLMKIIKNQRSKNSYLLRDLMNFNNIFGKNVNYDDIKSDQKTKLSTFFRQYIFYIYIYSQA